MKRGAVYFGIVVVVIALVVVLSHVLRSARSERELAGEESKGIAVTTIPLREPSPVDTISVTGTIHGQREAQVSAETGGRVIALYGEVGDFFSEAQAILQLDSSVKSLAAQQARIAFDKAEADLVRARNLFTAKSISDSELEGARLGAKSAETAWRMAQEVYSNTTIRAPFAGTLTRRSVEVGETVAPGMPVASLVDLRQVKAEFELTERELVATAEGDSVLAMIDVLPDITLRGTITARSLQAKAGTRTFPVEATFSGASGIASGMFMRGFIIVEGKGKGFLVPREALQGAGVQSHVFVVENGVAHARRVHSETPRGGWVVIYGDKLKPGDALIVTASKAIEGGAAVTVSGEGDE